MATSSTPMSVQTFIQSIGINSAINYTGTSYYNNPQSVLTALQYLGIDTLRDHTPYPNSSATWNSYGTLANAGVKFDFVIDGNGNVPLSTDLSNLDAFEKANPGSIAAIEGPNEINGWPITYNGITDTVAAGVQVMKDLWTDVKADPTLSSVPIYNLTLSDGFSNIQADETGLGNLSGFVNYGSAHVYAAGGNNLWTNDMPYWLPVQQQSTPGMPMVITETGYQTAVQPGSNAVSATVAAKYDLNALLDDTLNGISNTYFYELADSTTSSQSFGFFNADWTAKAPAVALHNLTSILNGSGTGTAQGTLNYSISGLPATGHSLLLGTGSSFDIAVWNDVTIWNQAAGQAVTAPNQTVTLNLGGTYSNVSVYDPLVGTAPITTYSSASTIQLSISDHPLIVTVQAPQGSPTTPPGSPATPSPNGTTITSASASPIIDQNGNAWSLVQSASNGLQIAVNGTVDQSTGFVAQLTTVNGTMVQENTAGNWYSEPGASGPWSRIAAPVTVGSGSDTLVVRVAEDAYANGDGTSDAQGDAAFTVSVDGKQLAGTFFATAPNSAGATQDFTLKGDWAPGTHTVTVNFLNDAYGGTAALDRNLYVKDITYDGTDTNQSAAFQYQGPTNFNVTDNTAVPAPAVGSGSDTLVLQVSEDAYKGDAQFTVSVDGKQLGGTFTATALHSSGASQSLAFKGDFGSGPHTVSVNFLNDKYGGSPSLDRNLYVNDVVYNGTDTKQSAALKSNGAKTFSISGGTTPSVSETGDHGSLQQNLSQTGTYTVGGDTFVLSSGNATSVTLGTGTSQLTFIGASSAAVTGGSGQATVVADMGNNTFVAGAGSMDVTGGAGKDAYVFHATSGLLTVEDFSTAKGDTLTVDKSLQGSMQQASDGKGGTMLTFGTGHSVDLHGVASLPSNNVLWA
jgi:hypothetical protein